jgi:hypothetical protein
MMEVSVVRTPFVDVPRTNHAAIVRAIDRVLADCGISSAVARRRMAEHAILASGWKQNIFHYNAWGVKRGRGWEGDWFSARSWEIVDGERVDIVGEWRAFRNWQESVDDYLGRLATPRYRAAQDALYSETVGDEEYFRALRSCGYFTGDLDDVLRTVRYVEAEWRRTIVDAVGNDLSSRIVALAVLATLVGLLVWIASR